MRNARLDEAQAGLTIAGRNISNLRYADDSTLMTESEEEPKSLLMKVKEESKKAGLKFNFQKQTKIRASSPITSWQTDGGTMETFTNFTFSGSKIIEDHDCSHEIKRHLLLGRKAMTNLDSMWKKRHHFADKGPYGQSYGFSSSHVWMWGVNHKVGWALKNGCLQTLMLEKTLKSPLGSMESKLSILKEINLEHSLEGLMLKLKCQYFGHLMQRDIRKDSDAGKD